MAKVIIYHVGTHKDTEEYDTKPSRRCKGKFKHDKKWKAKGAVKKLEEYYNHTRKFDVYRCDTCTEEARNVDH